MSRALTIDNRNSDQMIGYLEARVEALEARVKKFDEYIARAKEVTRPWESLAIGDNELITLLLDLAGEGRKS